MQARGGAERRRRRRRGGGLGDWRRRDPKLVERDLAYGYITQNAAERLYASAAANV
jgi:N-methylhydantoinase B/oxoprolinase/acetone carboxylase alpha subunit